MSRTKLKQRFSNPSASKPIEECIYVFPLYDGVSVVSFTCHIGQRTIQGVVKEKNTAKAVYDNAVSRGETAGLLTQLPESADIFTIKLGNIPSDTTVTVEIDFIGELKYDAENEGIRYTVPTAISPRYGKLQSNWENPAFSVQAASGFKITIDASMTEGAFIQSIQSPSHPIAVTMGVLSTGPNSDPVMHRASATLSLGSTMLDKDFVLVVKAKDTDTPKALLETHPTIGNHRALMLTLVPRFSLPSCRPEVVFVVDRSGSMENSILTLIGATKVYLKSLPVGVKFNICSFGSSHSFLWPKSRSYTQANLDEATHHVENFQADMGGTEIFSALQATIESRYPDLHCEVMLLTDGQIYQQERLFKYLEEQVTVSKGDLRLFSLGIGDGVSSSLIEGIARAGNGFAQTVGLGEKIDIKVIRMLKGALSPHISDYALEVHYEDAKDEINTDNDGFEMIDKVTDSFKMLLPEVHHSRNLREHGEKKAPILLFNESSNPDEEDLKMTGNEDEGRYFHLPQVPIPKLLQAPQRIPPLFPFTRTTVYLLMAPEASQKIPTSVVLRATSQYGPLKLEIPVKNLSQPGETLHQLAARKAIQDLEEGRGWIFDVKDESGKTMEECYPSHFDDMVEREAVRLGSQFQVAGKWCSFLAVSDTSDDIELKQNGRSPETLLPPEENVGFSLGCAASAQMRLASLSGSDDEDVSFAFFGDTGGRSSGSFGGSSSKRGASVTRSTSSIKGSNIFEAMRYVSIDHNDAHLQSTPFSKGVEMSRTVGAANTLSTSSAGSSGLFGGSGVVSIDHPKAYPQSITPFRGQSTARGMPSGGLFASFGSSSSPAYSLPRRSSPTTSSPVSLNEKVHAIIELQCFEGNWQISDRLIELLGIQAGDVLPLVRTDNYATILVITFLEGIMKTEEGVWELVVEKAKSYLDREESNWRGGVYEQAAKKIFGIT